MNKQALSELSGKCHECIEAWKVENWRKPLDIELGDFIEHCRIWFYHNTTHVTWSHVNAQGLVSHAGEFQYTSFQLSSNGEGTIFTSHSALDKRGIGTIEQ